MIPDVDVIVPVRNGGRLLAAAVDSVLSQTAVAARVIVVDDGSTDGAPGRLPRDERIVVVGNSGRGIPRGLNTGLALTTAPFVARQDADDESLPGRFEAQLEHFEEHPSIGLVATAFEVVVGKRAIATICEPPGGMLTKNPICAGSTMARRSVYLDVSGYRERFELSSDYDCWLRMCAVTGVSVIPFVGYRYRLNAGMVTIGKSQRQEGFARLARASRAAVLAGAPDPVDDDALSASIVATAGSGDEGGVAQIALWWAREFAALGSRPDALRCLRVAWPRLSRSERTNALMTTLLRPAPQVVWK